MRVPKACVSFLIALLLFSGCAGKEIKQETKNAFIKQDAEIENDRTLDLCMFQIDTLNPLATSVRHNAEVLSLLYDSLFVLTSNNEAVPNLCTNIEVSEDGCKATLDIRNNVFFQDGELLTEKDVVASVNFILKTEGFYQKRLSCVRTAEVKNGKVVILFRRNTENVSHLLDFPVLPEKFLSNMRENDVLEPPAVGSGIFSLTEYCTNQMMILGVNKAHHSGNYPYYETICLHLLPDQETALFMLENKEIDALAQSASRMHTYTPPADLQKKHYPTDRLLFLGCHEIGSELPEDVILSLCQWAEEEKVGTPPIQNLFPEIEESEREPKENIGFLYCRESLIQTRIAQKFTKINQANRISMILEDEPEKTYLSRVEKRQYDLFLGETESLPNLDRQDFAEFQEKNSPDGIVGLFFVNEFLYFQEGVQLGEIQTKNPYFCFTVSY